MTRNLYRMTTNCGLTLYVVAPDWENAYCTMENTHPDLDVVEASNVSRGKEVLIGDCYDE